MKIYPSKQAKNNFGAVIEEAQRQPVQLTKNGRPIGGIVNQELFDEILKLEQQTAQKKALAILKQMQAEAAQKPTATRAELKQLLECDDEEIDALFGDESFNP
jgi:prevent-host-death family protein